MRKLLLLMMMFAGLAGFKQDKSRRITGTVYGSDDQLPLPGVTVKVKGSPHGTQTDKDGRYKINVADSDTQLDIEFIGYNRQRVTIGKNDTINIYLISTPVRLDYRDLGTGRRIVIDKKDTMKKYTIPGEK